jgi:hypothetical protein
VGFRGALQEFEVWSFDFLDVLAAGRQTSYAADMIGGEPLGVLGNASGLPRAEIVLKTSHLHHIQM